MKHSTLKIILLCIFTAIQYTAFAYSFSSTCSTGQTLYYNILSDTTVAVTYPNSSGSSYYQGFSKPTGFMQIPATVYHGGTNYRVVAIGANAFHSCTGLTAVTIPTSVTAIEDRAFEACSGLSGIEIPSSVLAIGVGSFQSCSGLQTVQIGAAVSSIGNVAFEGCSSLHTLTIPDAVLTVGNWAFCNCTSLDTLVIGTSLAQIPYSVFAGCNNVQHIYYNARNAVCHYMTSDGYHTSLPVNSLQVLVIGDSVRTLNPYTFIGAAALDSVYIGLNVATIGANTFTGCGNVRSLHYNARNCSNASFSGTDTTRGFRPFSQLSTLVIGSAVRHIPDYAFYGCSNVSSPILLPDSLLTIGSHAFHGCSRMGATLSFPSTLLSVGTEAFRDCDSIFFFNTGLSHVAIPAGAFRGCDRLFQVTIGNNTPSIADSAFKGCIRLATATLGSSVTSIGSQAFAGCLHLVAPQFPDALTTIGSYAFNGCYQLGGNLTFPAAVATIGNYAFANTTPLTLIEMLGSVPPTIYDSTFASATSSTAVHVPCGSILTYYMSQHWGDFSNLSESSPYRISVSVNNSLMGSAAVTQQPTCSSPIARIQAFANTDYHFIRWNDGNSANPRTLIISSDSAFTAVFAPDNSYITVTCNDSTRGTVTGSGLYSYNAPVVLTATAFANYHFQCWSDGNTDNPRYFNAIQDSVFTAIFYSNISNITVGNNNPTMGTVSGSGTYYYQNPVVISATPFAGHHFTTWNDGVTANPRTVIVSQDSVFVANFAVNVYTVTATSNNPSMGIVTGGGSYPYLANAELSATAYYGHRFVQWSDSSTANPRTIQVVSDTALTAYFIPNTYTIEVVSNDTSMGNVFGGGTYSYGTTVTLSATAAYGFHFVQWNDGNTDNPRILTASTNVTYTAQFALNTYSLTVLSNNSTMGSVVGGGIYPHNTPVYITAVPNHGYRFVQWNDSVTDNPRLVTMTNNATYTAQFTTNSYTLTVISGNNAYGTVSGSGTYSYNSSAVITATPNYGYHFVQWNDGNTANPRTVVVTNDTGYTAQFAINSYQVVAVANNASAGTVSGSGSYVFQSTATLTAQPAAHYHFVQWNDGTTQNPRTVTVTSDTLLTALFAIDTHLVSAAAADSLQGFVAGAGAFAYGTIVNLTAIPAHGFYFTAWSDGNTQNPRQVTVTSDTSFTALFGSYVYTITVSSCDTLMGYVSGGGIYEYMANATMLAIPAEHHYFEQWSDGITTNPRILTVTSDSSLVALFRPDVQYTVTVNANSNAYGSVTGSGTYYGGDTATLSATPYSHYVFRQWNDGSTDNPRKVRVLSDVTYTAQFSLQTFIVTAQSNDPEMGAVYGGGEYAYGSTATLIARPFPDMTFECWSDGNTEMERTVTVTHNATYTAVFRELLGIDATEGQNVTVLTQGLYIVVNGTEGRQVILFDIMGRRIAASKQVESLTLRAPSAGVYLLQIEGLPARKVVVR